MKTNDIRDLKVWGKSFDVALDIYRITRFFPEDEKFGLSSQMRRCAVSIPSNIAEGHGRNSPKEFVQFLRITRGSIAELKTKILISNKLNYISCEDTNNMITKLSEIDKMTTSLIDFQQSL